MAFLGEEDESELKVVDGKAFEYYQKYFDRRYAKLKGEELKISGDISYYRVEKEDDGFILWIH